MFIQSEFFFFCLIMYEERHGKIYKHHALQKAHLLQTLTNRTRYNETGDMKWHPIMVIPHFKFLWSQETTGKIPSGDVRLNVMHSHPVRHLEKRLWGEEITVVSRI